jgi:hypothetical protein
MLSRTCLTSKLYDKIIRRPSKSHETIPLKLCFHLILEVSLNCWTLKGTKRFIDPIFKDIYDINFKKTSQQTDTNFSHFILKLGRIRCKHSFVSVETQIFIFIFFISEKAYKHLFFFAKREFSYKNQVYAVLLWKSKLYCLKNSLTFVHSGK